MTKRLSEAPAVPALDIPKGFERPAAPKVTIHRSTKLIPRGAPEVRNAVTTEK
jgi:hypothetical protein